MATVSIDRQIILNADDLEKLDKAVPTEKLKKMLSTESKTAMAKRKTTERVVASWMRA
ncbi:hypothetical protein HCA00_09665 [Listeria booriae]|uniref:Uncharacterized protein n=1 Tax=Listeria booriae TaxID=1552123 RepID=A0A7X1D4S8_9LIST|nr:hypothetical protein [Listeria booriae]MBC1553532.1 hypothetical protein [Listeria booriae]MBC2158686.1 hypothetical protein [Listeria booriae]MBC2166055.1 hypothetical protein [Listeria booriae]MBC2178626.1 hypothetical protein [Listeria booriae]MBC2188808.1 hypothetical protein [Listeria booriae]